MKFMKYWDLTGQVLYNICYPCLYMCIYANLLSHLSIPQDEESLGCMALHMCKLPGVLYLDGNDKNNYNNLKFLKVYRHMDHIEPMLRFKNDYTALSLSRLRLLHWDAFPLTALPHRYLKGLVEVILRHSNLTSFWTLNMVKTQ